MKEHLLLKEGILKFVFSDVFENVPKEKFDVILLNEPLTFAHFGKSFEKDADMESIKIFRILKKYLAGFK